MPTLLGTGSDVLNCAKWKTPHGVPKLINSLRSHGLLPRNALVVLVVAARDLDKTIQLFRLNVITAAPGLNVLGQNVLLWLRTEERS